VYEVYSSPLPASEDTTKICSLSDGSLRAYEARLYQSNDWVFSSSNIAVRKQPQLRLYH